MAGCVHVARVPFATLTSDPPMIVGRCSLLVGWLAGRFAWVGGGSVGDLCSVEICFARQAKHASWGSPLRAAPAPRARRAAPGPSDVGVHRDTGRPYVRPSNMANRTTCPIHHTCTAIPITPHPAGGRRALRARRPRDRVSSISKVRTSGKNIGGSRLTVPKVPLATCPAGVTCPEGAPRDAGRPRGGPPRNHPPTGSNRPV